MANNDPHITETIVNTLLQVGERVFEINEDLIITRLWHRPGLKADSNDYAGKNVAVLKSDPLFAHCSSLITRCLSTGEKEELEYTEEEAGKTTGYSVRILPLHPGKKHVFVVVEQLARKALAAPIEDRWKQALDASGDGVWDFDVTTDSISFSEKWHSIFGYGMQEIATGSAWAAKLHPDDLAKSGISRDNYISGTSPLYAVELRYLTKDNNYRWVLSRGVTIAKDAEGKPVRFIGTHTDIHERKLAGEKLAALAQLLSKLINNLRDGILVTDEHCNIIFANQVFCDMLDIADKPDQLIGAAIGKTSGSKNIFGSLCDELQQRAGMLLNHKEIVLDEEWAMNKSEVLSLDFIPLSLNDNSKGGIWKFRNITSQKNTEHRLSELRNFYEEILNHIAADIVVFDAQQRYLFINPAAIKNEELRKWMIGKTDEDYCRFRNKPFTLAERRRNIFNTARDERRSVEWEERLETPDGKIEYHLRNNYPVFDEQGKHIMSIGYGLNITDRKVAEEALKTSQETFASAFDHSGVGMALITLEGKWVDVNNALCIMTGYTKEELLQLSLADITYTEDFDNDADLLRKLRRREILTYSIERRFISRHNKIVLALLTVSLVWGTDGTPKFLIAQAVDITEKKALEQEINKKNTELEATRISLVNKIKQLEELSYIIAHNLRGPAGNIKMLSGALLPKTDGRDGSPVEDMLSGAFTTEEVISLIQDSSISLMDSLSTLMEITEIKLNKEIPYNDCDTALIIKDITSQLHSMIFEKQAKINTDLQVQEIRYPKAYLENILYNLISNALKYSRAQLPPEINITTRMSGGRVQIIVKDNGMGIDMAQYGDKVFKLNEVFHQGYDSKGIGLYITKTQVESFGGTISVASAINEGCEFTVTL